MRSTQQPSMWETVARAAQTMCRDEVGNSIVLQNNLPIGIVTERISTARSWQKT